LRHFPGLLFILLQTTADETSGSGGSGTKGVESEVKNTGTGTQGGKRDTAQPTHVGRVDQTEYRVGEHTNQCRNGNRCGLSRQGRQNKLRGFGSTCYIADAVMMVVVVVVVRRLRDRVRRSRPERKGIPLSFAGSVLYKVSFHCGERTPTTGIVE
jgi:hypothetical protein